MRILALLLAVLTLVCGPLDFAMAQEAHAAAEAAHGTAEEGAHGGLLDLRMHWVGFASIAIFVIAYLLVMLEEVTHMRKSKPVIIAAGLIWLLVGFAYTQAGNSHVAEEAIRHALLEYAELMLFLLAAMTYVNAMDERRVFDALRNWLTKAGFSYRQLFWITGILAFLLSPLIDNLTTALVMGAVVMAVGTGNSRFVPLACVNVVIAANAGGAFSPFGDITTLMVWQRGHAEFFDFFAIFLPSVVNYIIPAIILYMAVPNERPVASSFSNEPLPVAEGIHGAAAHAAEGPSGSGVTATATATATTVTMDAGALPASGTAGTIRIMKHGAWSIIALFAATIATAVSFHNFVGLPPVFGMMLGLGYLQVFGFYLRRISRRTGDHEIGLDTYIQTARAEWDTLLFFYGVIMAVGGLSLVGYLGTLSIVLYDGFGATTANIVIGVLSAILDNIPLMFAVLTMEPEMSLGQWLLITLTAGVGGSLLSIGSAAGVALMGTARGYYTFFSHLKWSWAIALGYVASIATHLFINGHLF